MNEFTFRRGWRLDGTPFGRSQKLKRLQMPFGFVLSADTERLKQLLHGHLTQRCIWRFEHWDQVDLINCKREKQNDADHIWNKKPSQLKGIYGGAHFHQLHWSREEGCQWCGLYFRSSLSQRDLRVRKLKAKNNEFWLNYLDDFIANLNEGFREMRSSFE